MKYHIRLEYGTSLNHYWWNLKKENAITSVVIPFINGQVILAQSGDQKIILNMKNASRLGIYRTRETVKQTEKKTRIELIKEKKFKNKYSCTEEILKEAKLELSSPQVHSLLEKSFANIENQVFVVMKFGDRILGSAFEGVIKPVFHEMGIKVIRVDEVQDSGKISDQILELIAQSRFIFSDLSGERPNCYYETGFAHALGKEIILAIRKGDKIHFDLSGYRFIVWETESDLRRELKKRIKALIEKED